MIVYREGGNGTTTVYVEGRLTGTIRPVDGGFAYFPKGTKLAGETFPSISAVKRSLETE